MSTALTKTSKIVKSATSNVRSHLDVVERAREIYLAQIKRAESDYFDRIKRATAVLTGEDAVSDDSHPTQEAPAEATQ